MQFYLKIASFNHKGKNPSGKLIALINLITGIRSQVQMNPQKGRFPRCQGKSKGGGREEEERTGPCVLSFTTAIS